MLHELLIPAAYADAAAPAAAGPAGTGFEWVFLVGFLVIFYLMIWRPQAKRAKEHKNLLGNLQKVTKSSLPAVSPAR